MPTADCRSRPRAPANINGPPRRCDQNTTKTLRCAIAHLRFDAEPVLGPRLARTRWHRPGMTTIFESASRVIGCVGLAEDVDRISRPEVTSGECRISVKREITDRECGDAIEDPDRDTFHQVTPARPATAA